MGWRVREKKKVELPEWMVAAEKFGNVVKLIRFKEHEGMISHSQATALLEDDPAVRAAYGNYMKMECHKLHLGGAFDPAEFNTATDRLKHQVVQQFSTLASDLKTMCESVEVGA